SWDGDVDSGTGTGAQLGTSVAAIGDVTGDGIDDVAVGAPKEYAHTFANEGEVFILGDASALPSDLANATGHILGDDDAGQGGLYLFRGGTSGDTDLGLSDGRWSPDSTESALGTSVAAAGDVNRDGTVDLLLGDPGDDAHGASTGVVYLVLGPARGTYAIG